MANQRDLARLRRALSWNREDEDLLADSFIEQKIAVYEQTLRDLADDFGYQLEDDLRLSDDVLTELGRESVKHARLIVQTHNSELDQFLDRNAGQPPDQLIEDYETWAQARADWKSEQVAVTEAYSAHADATLGFFRAAGVEPEFDFGDHPELGDEPPVCPVCALLEATNPHPMSQVVAIGIPHVQCRQSWHPRVDDDTLPDELVLGRDLGGLMNTDPLVNRSGNSHAAAVDFINAQVASQEIP